MPEVHRDGEVNRLLAELPQDEYDLVCTALEAIELRSRQVLAVQDQPVEFAYFPRGAVLSLLTTMSDGGSVEAATVGMEGMFGVSIVLGNTLAYDETVTQISGHAARISRAKLHELLPRCPSLTRLLLRYAYGLMGQLSRTAGCNRAHPIEERCARWLLLVADRTGSDDFRLTQEFLAIMLGVHRPSLTLAVGALERAGLIEYTRGHLRICNRAGLENAACEDYVRTQQIVDQVFQKDRPQWYQ